MAIDTAAKRKSCIGLAFMPGRTGIIPDDSNLGTLEDRMFTDLLYIGITSGPTVAPTDGPAWFQSGQVYVPGFQQGGIYRPGFE